MQPSKPSSLKEMSAAMKAITLTQFFFAVRALFLATDAQHPLTTGPARTGNSILSSGRNLRTRQSALILQWFPVKIH